MQDIKQEIQLTKRRMNITIKDVKIDLQDHRSEFDAYHENVSFSIGMLKRNLNAIPDQDYLLDNVTMLENKIDDLSKGIFINM